MATIIGGSGNDTITTGTTGNDTVGTGAGSDWVIASGGSDTYSLGYKFGSQYIRYGHGDWDTLDYRGIAYSMGIEDPAGVRLVADLDAGWIRKYNAAGTLVGTDTAVGLDALYGSEGADTLRGRENWSYEQFRGYAGNDTIDGRGGEDMVNYAYAIEAGIVVNMAGGTVSSSSAETGIDTLRGIESVAGTRFSDTYDATGYSGTSLNRNSSGADWNIFNPLGGDDIIIGNGRTILAYGDVGGSVTISLAGLTTVSTSAHIVKAFTADANPNNFDAGDLVVSGVNMVITGSGNDSLVGGGRVNDDGATPENTLSGDASFEQFRGQGGNDTISGASGFDRADYRQGTPMVEGITVRLAAGVVVGDAVVIGTDRLRGVESVRSTYLDDLYDATGFTLANAATASVNNGDVRATTIGGETLASYAFNEFVVAGGNDLVTGNGATRVTLDLQVENRAGTSSVTVFTSASAGVADYGLTDGGLGRVTFTGTFAVRGGTGNDSMTGAAGHQNLSGAQGNDTLAGGAGADFLHGNTNIETPLASGFTDDDLLAGGDGNDLLRGGLGNDALQGDAGNDTLDGGAGIDTMAGGLGNDTYYVDAAGDVVTETGASGSGTDTVTSTVSRTLGSYQENLDLAGTAAINGTGNSLANVLRGNSLANVLDGGSGNDSLAGNSGNDVLRGGAGQDVLTGGNGVDKFAFLTATDSTLAAFDRITDFLRGGDKLDLAALDANAAAAGVQGFAFIGTAAFGANATGQLRYAYDAGTGATMLYGSTDADATAEFAVQLTGVTSLTASDFVF